MTRMAGLGTFLKEAFKPQGKWDALLTYGPDLGFAALSAAAAPGGPNALVGAEDLLISLGGSALGRVGGRMAGQALFKDNPQNVERIQQVADLGISAPLQMFAPRPILEGAIERQVQGQRAQQQAGQQAEERETQEQLIQALLTSGALAMPQTYSPAALLV